MVKGGAAFHPANGTGCLERIWRVRKTLWFWAFLYDSIGSVAQFSLSA